MRTRGTEEVGTAEKPDFLRRIFPQKRQNARHVGGECFAVSFSLKKAGAKPVVRPKRNRCAHTACPVAERTQMRRSCGTTTAATAIFSASPSRNGATQRPSAEITSVLRTQTNHAVPKA